MVPTLQECADSLFGTDIPSEQDAGGALARSRAWRARHNEIGKDRDVDNSREGLKLMLRSLTEYEDVAGTTQDRLDQPWIRSEEFRECAAVDGHDCRNSPGAG